MQRLWYNILAQKGDRQMVAEKTEKKSDLEKEYEKLFQKNLTEWLIAMERLQSLRQPSPLRIVDSVVTYGAYEEPI